MCALVTSFIGVGDGKRVAQTINNVTTYFIGNYYEVQNPGAGQTVTKYYYAGSQRVAMRTNGTLYYMLSDHLGSTSLTTDANGNVLSELRYSAWGEVRYNSGVTPTDYTYTGQYGDSYINLLWYGSRHYDPELGRFIKPDSIVPDPSNPQAWDRYAYALNNPIRYNDPSGHKVCVDVDKKGNCQGDKLARFLDYVHDKIINKDGFVKRDYEALEVMNMVVGKAASIYGKDWDGFLKATNFVFLGTYSNGPLTMLKAHSVNPIIKFFSDVGDSGFNHDFYQGGDNQVRHFWAAFATAAYREPGFQDHEGTGVKLSVYGSFYHDVFEDWLGEDDTTLSDLELSLVGAGIGLSVYSGAIVSPSSLPGVFDSSLGIHGPGYTGPNLEWLFITPNK